MAIKEDEMLIRCGKKLRFIDSKLALYCETFQLLHFVLNGQYCFKSIRGRNQVFIEFRPVVAAICTPLVVLSRVS